VCLCYQQTRTHTHAQQTHTHIRTHTHTYTHTHTRTHTYTHIHNNYKNTHTHPAPNEHPTSHFDDRINQSYNVGINYCNRSGNEMDTKSIGMAYAGAVLTSCTIALTLGHFVKKSTAFSPSVRTLVQKLVPFVSVATAGASNVFLMRRNEMKEGISVTNQEGTKVYGTSVVAGRKAVLQTTLTRVALPAPILILPPIIMKFLNATKFFRKNPRISMPVEILTIIICLWGALPMAIGLFPQQYSVPVTALEESFHDMKDEDGEHISVAYFNRGI